MTYLVLALALAAGLSACGGGNDETAATTSNSTAGAADFDSAFIDAMVPHHRDAIAMAKAATGAGLSQPELKKIASDIVMTQQTEIDQMLDWRADWFGSRTIEPGGAERLGLTDEEAGMMSHAEGEIANADDVDATFAQMMVVHHEGAIAMATRARDEAEHEELRDLAARIVVAQENEVVVLGRHSDDGHHG